MLYGEGAPEQLVEIPDEQPKSVDRAGDSGRGASGSAQGARWPGLSRAAPSSVFVVRALRQRLRIVPSVVRAEM